VVGAVADTVRGLRNNPLARRNARLHEEIQAARREATLAAEDAERLQKVTEGLSAAATTEQIADVIIEQGIPALAASTGVLGVLEGAAELRLSARPGTGTSSPSD
jgi:hypothetical protein